jgi:AcrR family transcriptional regulator
VRPDVNVRPPDSTSPPTLEFGPEMLGMLRDGGAGDPDAAGNAAFDALLASARDVFVARGYHNTRVSDLVAAAGVSHGAFYRYFGNKEQLARVLTARAMQAVGAAVREFPDVSQLEGPSGTGVLRRWLRSYHAAHAGETSMMRVWADAALQDAAIKAESAPLFDWGRRRMARYLRPRGFGDVEVEAVVMVALLGVFGARHRSAADVDAAAHIIERGLLGR